MIRPRSDVLRTPVAEHGGRLGARDAAKVRLDFSACLNAFGPSNVVAQAIVRAAVDEYPDPSSRLACEAAANRWSISASEVAFGAGAAEFIHAICFALLRRDDVVLIAAPAFGEYARSATLCGAQPRYVRLANDNATPFVAEIARLKPRVAFVAAPVSPTGEMMSHGSLRVVADACRDHGTLLVIDQAYDPFSETPLGTSWLLGRSNVLYLRSLTKDHAIAGVRAAFAVSTPDVIGILNRVRVPWAASSVAQSAAIAAMTDEAHAHVTRTTDLLRAEARRIAAACRSRGLEVSNSTTHYFTIRCGDGRAAQERLMVGRGILVRECASFGLADCIRVAARTPIDNDQLIASLDLLADAPRRATMENGR